MAATVGHVYGNMTTATFYNTGTTTTYDLYGTIGATGPTHAIDVEARDAELRRVAIDADLRRMERPATIVAVDPPSEYEGRTYILNNGMIVKRMSGNMSKIMKMPKDYVGAWKLGGSITLRNNGSLELLLGGCYGRTFDMARRINLSDEQGIYSLNLNTGVRHGR
jgi:hypothetical protein